MMFYSAACLVCIYSLQFEPPFIGVQTPNCIRQTVFDAVALDYQSVTVIFDATAAATPDIHAGKQSNIRICSFIY